MFDYPSAAALASFVVEQAASSLAAPPVALEGAAKVLAPVAPADRRPTGYRSEG